MYLQEVDLCVPPYAQNLFVPEAEKWLPAVRWVTRNFHANSELVMITSLKLDTGVVKIYHVQYVFPCILSIVDPFSFSD